VYESLVKYSMRFFIPSKDENRAHKEAKDVLGKLCALSRHPRAGV
jgi:hypothetical protein